jgi:2-methylcitrate dehydratase PrpD
MVQKFCSSGEREGVKGAVHGAACVIAAAMAMYNIAAWGFRRERHLGTNALVYTLAVAWEVKQTMRHIRHFRHRSHRHVAHG